MRELLARIALVCLFPFAADAAPKVSREDAELMRIEALADRLPERIHGSTDFLLEDPDAAVDRTTGAGKSSTDDDCANIPVVTKRSDGRIVTRRVNVCD